MPYKVVIAEDFRMIREIFEATIEQSEEYTLAGSFPTAVEALDYLEIHDADLALMDVLIPGSMNGLDVAEKIKSVRPDIKVIIVTSMPEISYEKRAKEIGIEGFWQKEVQEQSIKEIMDLVMSGKTVYPSEPNRIIIGNTVSTDFTDREVDILRELVTGASNKEIADRLGVEMATIKMHISNMLQKTGYKSRLELAVKARHLGLAIND